MQPLTIEEIRAWQAEIQRNRKTEHREFLESQLAHRFVDYVAMGGQDRLTEKACLILGRKPELEKIEEEKED